MIKLHETLRDQKYITKHFFAIKLTSIVDGYRQASEQINAAHA